jgi:hypothetical protein
MPYDEWGDPVKPGDVLTDEELEEYYADKRAGRTRKQVRTVGRDSDEGR